MKKTIKVVVTVKEEELKRGEVWSVRECPLALTLNAMGYNAISNISSVEFYPIGAKTDGNGFLLAYVDAIDNEYELSLTRVFQKIKRTGEYHPVKVTLTLPVDVNSAPYKRK